ncbi:hypothetical protein ACFC0D_30535 [Streptomyces sp. NPDC056222]|uniref:hypothetical protein n=1 Tax=Streptomyces sp. NPDC056222 TaxID=3345749 RepID=UPI0035DED58B
MFDAIHMRPCGRPTKTGNPCRAQFSGRGFACKIHTTDHEKQLVDAYEQGLRAGREEGRRQEQQTADIRVENLERQVRTLEEKLDTQNRRFEIDGHQCVTVGRYAYVWTGPGRLKVGDRVLLPENYVSALRQGPGPQPGTVTALGSTYTGTHSKILSRLPASG